MEGLAIEVIKQCHYRGRIIENLTNSIIEEDIIANLNCEELQLVFGSPMPLPIHVANVL